jgi:hypothetical protein
MVFLHSPTMYSNVLTFFFFSILLYNKIKNVGQNRTFRNITILNILFEQKHNNMVLLYPSVFGFDDILQINIKTFQLHFTK